MNDDIKLPILSKSLMRAYSELASAWREVSFMAFDSKCRKHSSKRKAFRSERN